MNIRINNKNVLNDAILKIIMKKLFLLLFLLTTFNCWPDEPADTAEYHQSEEISLNDFIFEISGFDYFSGGAGFNFGSLYITGSHFFAWSAGALLEFNTKLEFIIRPYGYIYGGSGGMLFGLSVPVNINPDSFSFGFSPEIGVGIGPFQIGYRYNFYLDSTLNCHEISIRGIASIID